MTEEEAAALAQILSRMPLTQAEVLWLHELLARLTPPAPMEPAEQQQNGQQPIVHEEISAS